MGNRLNGPIKAGATLCIIIIVVKCIMVTCSEIVLDYSVNSPIENRENVNSVHSICKAK